MKIIIKSKNLELTPSLQSFIEKKIGTVEKFINILKKDTDDGLKTLAEIFVEIEKETNHHNKGEIFLVKNQVVLPGKSLMVEFRSDDMFKAIIGAKDELKTEIEKYKVKKIDKNRRIQRKLKTEIEK